MLADRRIYFDREPYIPAVLNTMKVAYDSTADRFLGPGTGNEVPRRNDSTALYLIEGSDSSKHGRLAVGTRWANTKQFSPPRQRT